MNLSGSYRASDVTFLLKVVDIATTDISAKERLIQEGTHYSEMLSFEKSPSAAYLRLFFDAVTMNAGKLGAYVASLAATIAHHNDGEVVIVSLARAGTPIGVLLHRALRSLGRASKHYSVSIIRDRGIDWVALDYITSRHKDKSIVFVDGWTGKGVVTGELFSSVTAYNSSRGTKIDPSLCVVADLAGTATFAATSEDFLIPNAVLNSTVSGLISRSVLSSKYVSDGDFHACAYYEEKSGEDLSQYYVDALTPHVLTALVRAKPGIWPLETRAELNRISNDFVAEMTAQFSVHRNQVKPGIGESTRAMLRRVPEMLLVQDDKSPAVKHLMQLAQEGQVPVQERPAMPYRAAAIIKSVSD
ncbi:MAG: cysteine protease StiP family protein [Candidatus Obscuribacterales bacterium]|nr:cysteine protease StiP family protein [Candidatus Obscuribacterales bacterium]